MANNVISGLAAQWPQENHIFTC